MTKEQARDQLLALIDEDRPDPEKSHETADRILLELLRTNGFEEAVGAFEYAREFCGFWYA